MTADIDMAVLDLLVRELGIARDRLVPKARLFHDLGVDGADGRDLFDALHREFGVDIRQFEPQLHFGPEAGPNPVLHFYWLIRPSARHRFIPISVADLIRTARSKAWTTPTAPAVP